jgi:hypothetical protein
MNVPGVPLSGSMMKSGTLVVVVALVVVGVLVVASSELVVVVAVGVVVVVCVVCVVVDSTAVEPDVVVASEGGAVGPQAMSATLLARMRVLSMVSLAGSRQRRMPGWRRRGSLGRAQGR